MDRSLSAIIEDERADTRNGDTDSIPDRDFVKYNQYAQDRLVSLISAAHNWVFLETVDIAVTANTTLYSLNRNVLFGTRIVQVEYSYDGAERNFVRLMPTPNRYQRLVTPGRPVYYRRRNGQVEIEPPPAVTQGTLRVTYERQRDRVDIKRGKVNGTPASATITLTDPFTGGNLSTETQLLVNSADQLFQRYVCISNLDGTRLLTNGIISSFTATTIVLAANVSTYLETGVVLADLANMMLTIGKYSSTHSELPNECERYLTEYTNRRVMNRDSNADWDQVDAELAAIELDIVQSFKLPDKDIKHIPISDWAIMIPGYE